MKGYLIENKTRLILTASNQKDIDNLKEIILKYVNEKLEVNNSQIIRQF